MMKMLIPDTIAARTLVVLILGLSVSHILSMGFYFNDRAEAIDATGREHIGERIATIVRLVSGSNPGERARIAELADGSRLHVTLGPASANEDVSDDNWHAAILRKSLIAHLGKDMEGTFRVGLANDAGPEPWQKHLGEGHGENETGEKLLVSVQLADSSWLNFAAPIERPTLFWSFRFVISLGVMLLAIIVLSAVVVSHLTRPLAIFAGAAKRLGADVNSPPLPETGPVEVQEAIGAFNRMQNRIRRFVEDRMQMISAISHDLGTPITRLRLRAEFVEDEIEQNKMLADLDDMEKMVLSTLSFVRDEANTEPRAMVDIRTLLQRVCDGLTDTGSRIKSDLGGTAIPLSCAPVAMRRALTNLIGNAVKYGRRAYISLESRREQVLILIDDDGPGIPEEFHEDVFMPFRRLDPSRNRDTGGTGLGLTVARSIVRAHGGDVIVSNREEGGLRVEVRLPK